MNKEQIKRIKEEMNYWFGINLTDNQIEEYAKIKPEIHEVFDTVEREKYIDYIVKKLINMEYPMNGDPEEYKIKFWNKIIEIIPNSEYDWPLNMTSH